MMTKLNTTIARRAAASMLAAGLALAFTPALAADKELKLKKVAAPVVLGSAQTGNTGGGFQIKSVPPKAPAAAGSRQIAVEPKGLVAPKAPTAPSTGVAKLEIPKAPTSTGVARIEVPKAERPKVAVATPGVTLTDATAAPAPVAPAATIEPRAEAAPVVEPKAVVKPAAPVTHHNSYSAYYGGHAGYYVQPSYGYGYGYRGGYGGFRNCH